MFDLVLIGFTLSCVAVVAVTIVGIKKGWW